MQAVDTEEQYTKVSQDSLTKSTEEVHNPYKITEDEESLFGNINELIDFTEWMKTF